MTQLVVEKGRTDKQVLEKSQELDGLLNEFQQFITEKNEKEPGS